MIAPRVNNALARIKRTFSVVSCELDGCRYSGPWSWSVFAALPGECRLSTRVDGGAGIELRLFNIAYAERINYEDRAAGTRHCVTGNKMVHKQTGILLTFLVSAILVSQGHANVPVKDLALRYHHSRHE